MNAGSAQQELGIGIFDSGVGGLTVMNAVAQLLPGENLNYLGDTARVPYGNRGKDTIRRYAINASEFLANRGIKALVIACNTATAYALEDVRAHLSIPVIGVIAPVSEEAAKVSTTRRVGVIGTRGTIRSDVYVRALHAFAPDVQVIQQACPLFVPLAEEGWLEGDVVEQVARSYLKRFAGTEIDTLILGCTHYPILKTTLQKVANEIMQRDVLLLDSAAATAIEVARILDEKGLKRAAPQPAALRFCATDDPRQFSKTAGRFFGSELDDVEHVDLPVANG